MIRFVTPGTWLTALREEADLIAGAEFIDGVCEELSGETAAREI